jgi:Domain of unknown function (DUF4349)
MKALRVVAILLMVLLLAACGGSGGDATSSGSSESAAGGGFEEGGTQLSRTSAEEAAVPAAGVAGGDEAAADDAGGDGDAAVEPPDIEPLPDPPAVRPGDRVIKEGTISVEVEKGEFDSSFRAVIEAARRYGGDVAASSTSTSDNGDIFGSVTVRVPVENFEDLVVGLGNIGTVVNRDVSSQDVSAEYTDLQSRLRHLQAQERFYLGLFDEAETVEDAIRVQQQLDGIQASIEKIKGRMNYLDDRTSYSTLAVELFEPGAGAPLLEAEEPTTDRPTFAHYWDTARDAFVNVVGAMFVVLVFLAPLLVPAVIVGALWMSNRRRRQPEPPAPPARQDEPETVGADR